MSNITKGSNSLIYNWIYKFSNDVTVGIPNFQDYWEAEFEISFE